jgi:IS30 family transposase
MVAVLRIEPGTRIKRCLLAMRMKLRKVVARKLILDLSPEQISGPLRIQYRIRVAPHVAPRLSPINPH